MSSSEIFITKRDGKRERFSIDKIRAAIAKAFLSVGSFATDEMLTQILGRIRVADGTTVEQIQNQVETALMAERYYKVAKAYIIYRQEHTEDREVRDKLQFLMNYCEAKNPATGSKYDANANVENKNIATLIGELPKQNLIVLLACVLTVGLILGAAAVAYFGFGAANVAKDIAVGAGTVATLQLVRVARRWHRRFAVRFNLCRLALCLALLFSSAAYHGARGIVKGICLLASNDHLYAPTAISGMVLCTLAALAMKYAVNRLPAAHFHRAPWLGWGIGMLLTLAAGFFLSMAIQK